jgi:uncharacterized protein (DUF1330 family)
VAVTLCVLLWARTGRELELGDYEDRVLALLADHGAKVLQRVRPVGGVDEPTEVHLLQFPDEAALDAYTADARRAALAAERDEAIERTEILRVDVVG